jgi:hypothetical protein
MLTIIIISVASNVFQFPFGKWLMLNHFKHIFTSQWSTNWNAATILEFLMIQWCFLLNEIISSISTLILPYELQHDDPIIIRNLYFHHYSLSSRTRCNHLALNICFFLNEIISSVSTLILPYEVHDNPIIIHNLYFHHYSLSSRTRCTWFWTSAL